MSQALHAAIRHALADSAGYRARGILVSPILNATADLRLPNDVLYNAVYTLFCALPWRLVPGTSIFIATMDVPGGVELAWECREEPPMGGSGLRDALRQGPHGDLVDIAYGALEQFCGLRAGECLAERAVVPSSPQFPRGEAVLRRVRAFLPVSREEGLVTVAEWRARAQG